MCSGLSILIDLIFKDERTKILASFFLLLRKSVFYSDAPIAFTSALRECVSSSSGSMCLCA